jgi:hypothetical protein
MPNNTAKTLTRLKWLTLIIAMLYIASIATGLVTRSVGGEFFTSFVEESDSQSAPQIERIFGRFREPVREGHLGTIALCSLIVFAINTLGSILRFIGNIFIVPVVNLFFCGWMIGISLGGIEASSFISLLLFLTMCGLEWCSYVISSVAGVNIGLSVLMPKRQGVASRWKAFKLSWRDAGRLYIIILTILAVQAVFEILYVRKVLLMGGSGVPLQPY